ncbi:CHASE2 domain-containing protein [Ottowia thiooxydans]|uniref:CHASE2 domain-containing protein n=1 Tax=Ottowia thiooxydans TaxID=219182 RepID=UPI00048F351B|nr:CHASE2 domain-containing protein [Ottowia thiooxydans]
MKGSLSRVLAKGRHKRFVLECGLLALLLPPLLLWLSGLPGLWHADAQSYDRLLPLARHAPSSDILVVAVDERSLQALGRWPWPREVHGELLEALAPHQPRAVMLDMFFTEPSEEPRDDQALVRGMAKVPTYLPLLLAPLGWTESAAQQQPSGSAYVGTARPGFVSPVPRLAQAARGMGHVNVTPDADGVLRTLFLEEGPTGHMQPYVGKLMQGATNKAVEAAPQVVGSWSRRTALRLPFAGPAGTYQTVPYISVLQGEVPPELIRGRTVLVGAMDTMGLGDQVQVPGGVLAGVEVHANALDAIFHGYRIGVPTRWQHGSWIAAVVVLALFLFGKFSRHALACATGIAIFTIAISMAAMALSAFWLPLAGPLLGVVLAYILWSWRRQHALARFIQQRIAALDAVVQVVPESTAIKARVAATGIDFQTRALDQAINDLMALRAQEQVTRRQREEWLRFLSHDLRSPQVSILSLLELWRGKAHGMDEATLADGVRREAKRTLALAEGFIDMTTAESGQYQCADCLAGSLVMDALDQVWPYASSRSVQLQHDLPGEECLLHADAHMVTRAMVNLLNNAIRHSPAGGVVLVRLEQRIYPEGADGVAARPAEVVLKVQDHGDGMDENQLLAVLDPVSQEAGASPLRIRGMGVGLAVVRAVVARHGGWLHAISTLGEGTEFLIGLPTKASYPDDLHQVGVE